MWNQFQLFITPIMTSIISIVIGFIMLKYPPKEINMLYGYRTKKSMSSQEAWDFSQKYASKKMIQIGIILLLICVLVSAFKIPEKAYPTIIISGIIIGVLALLLIIPITERQLKARL